MATVKRFLGLVVRPLPKALLNVGGFLGTAAVVALLWVLHHPAVAGVVGLGVVVLLVGVAGVKLQGQVDAYAQQRPRLVQSSLKVLPEPFGTTPGSWTPSAGDTRTGIMLTLRAMADRAGTPVECHVRLPSRTDVVGHGLMTGSHPSYSQFELPGDFGLPSVEEGPYFVTWRWGGMHAGGCEFSVEKR